MHQPNDLNAQTLVLDRGLVPRLESALYVLLSQREAHLMPAIDSVQLIVVRRGRLVVACEDAPLTGHGPNAVVRVAPGTQFVACGNGPEGSTLLYWFAFSPLLIRSSSRLVTSRRIDEKLDLDEATNPRPRTLLKDNAQGIDVSAAVFKGRMAIPSEPRPRLLLGGPEPVTVVSHTGPGQPTTLATGNVQAFGPRAALELRTGPKSDVARVFIVDT